MFSIPDPSTAQWVFIAVVAIAGSARIVRLIGFDHYPPAEWLRAQWDARTDPTGQGGGWNLLLHCGYCLAPWTTLGVLLWGYLTDWNMVWWMVNGWLGASYLTAILVAYDGDD